MKAMPAVAKVRILYLPVEGYPQECRSRFGQLYRLFQRSLPFGKSGGASGLARSTQLRLP